MRTLKFINIQVDFIGSSYFIFGQYFYVMHNIEKTRTLITMLTKFMLLYLI